MKRRLVLLYAPDPNFDRVLTEAVAYANGARVWLNKPLPAALLANAISEVTAPDQPLVAA